MSNELDKDDIDFLIELIKYVDYDVGEEYELALSNEEENEYGYSPTNKIKAFHGVTK